MDFHSLETSLQPFCLKILSAKLATYFDSNLQFLNIALLHPKEVVFLVNTTVFFILLELVRVLLNEPI
jgi:hypothetical protein